MRKLAASLLLAPSLALASGYSLPNTNPRDLGVCASAVAAQRDSGAAFALPAALARLRGPYASLGGGAVTVLNEWTDTSPVPNATVARIGDPPEPTKTSLDEQYTPFPNISFAYGGTLKAAGDRGWGAGISIQPFGGAILKWPGDWAGRYRITDIDRESFSAIASAGIEIVPQVRIGGGVMYYRTMQDLELKAWMQPFPPGTVANPDATAKLDMDGGAWSYDVSIEIEPLKGVPLMIGVDYKHKATQGLEGDISFTNMQAAATNPLVTGPLAGLYGATSVAEQLTIPNLLNVGVSYRVIKPLLAMFTYTFDRWVVYGEDRFNLSGGPNNIDFVVPRKYGNGQTFRAGAEYDLTKSVQLRGGVQRDLSGLDKSVYSPTLPDSDSWGFSLGGTIRLPKGFSVDAAIFYATMDDVTSTPPAGSSEPPAPNPNPPPATLPIPTGTFRGTYEPQAFVFTAAVAWHPGAK